MVYLKTRHQLMIPNLNRLAYLTATKGQSFVVGLQTV